MTAKTQLRANSPFTGRRYGTFDKRVKPPDFLHGAISIRPYCSGEITIGVHVSGDVWSNSVLAGRIEVNP